MCSKILGTNVSGLVGYTYPKLHKGKEWYVDFYALDPVTNKMKRKKYAIDTNLRIAERNRRATEIINVVSTRLMKGWNPWITSDSSRGYVFFEDCINRYLEYVDRMERKKTRQGYRSRINVMNEYLKTRVTPIKFAYQFDEAFCNDFLDWIYIERDNTPRTRNNYRGWLYSFAEFLISRKNINSNPVERIRVLPEHTKFRKDLTAKMLKQMTDYLIKNDRPFLLACMMQYYTLIRPGELSHLKIGDISVKKQAVFVSGVISKNHKDANVGLNSEIIKLMLDLNIFKHPSDCYLFSEDFLPGMKRMNPDNFNKRWKQMRAVFNWDGLLPVLQLEGLGHPRPCQLSGCGCGS